MSTAGVGDIRIFDGWGSWENARAALKRVLPVGTVSRLDDGYAFAAQAHRGQARPAGEPYVDHLREVVQILVEGAGSGDEAQLLAALLHDTVEDTAVTLSDVREVFGPEVADLVSWVTMPVLMVGDRQSVRAQYLGHLRRTPLVARRLKLADRYSNVQRLDTHPRPEKQRSYAAETVEHFIPLALGDPFYEPLFAAWQRRMSLVIG